jgi:NADPH:quinone reductase-like Zn-dependent oxidoreductase
MDTITIKTGAAAAIENHPMQAMVISEYGSPDALRLSEVERPNIGAAEVLVRVRAAGVDRGTWHLLTGKPYLVRLMGFGLRRPKNPVPGLDVAGTVEAIGAAVTRFNVGDEVFGISKGSFAQYACAREDKLARKPTKLTFEQAAVSGISGLTAVQSLRDAGKLKAGQRVLIIGASGGVGSFAVQVAKAWGAHVTGVCSTAKVDLVRALGADDIIDYTQSDFSAGPPRFDVILDIGGNTPLLRLRRSLAQRGRLVFVGGEQGGKLTGGFFGRPLLGLMLSPFVRQRFLMFMSKEHFADLEQLARLVEAGKVTPSVDRTYPLRDAAQALRDLEAGQVRGKVAITVVQGRAT